MVRSAFQEGANPQQADAPIHPPVLHLRRHSRPEAAEPMEPAHKTPSDTQRTEPAAERTPVRTSTAGSGAIAEAIDRSPRQSVQRQQIAAVARSPRGAAQRQAIEAQ